MTTTMKANKKNLERMRKELREYSNACHQEERELVARAANMTYGNPMTARDISVALGGALSTHEVAGNLCNRQGSRYYYTSMLKGDQEVHIGYKKRTRKFVEVDDNGNILHPEKVITRTYTVNTYTVGR